MGKIWGNLFYIKNIVYHRVSPYELNPFASECHLSSESSKSLRFEWMRLVICQTNSLTNPILVPFLRNLDFWKKSWQGINRDFTENGPFVIACELHTSSPSILRFQVRYWPANSLADLLRKSLHRFQNSCTSSLTNRPFSCTHQCSPPPTSRSPGPRNRTVSSTASSRASSTTRNRPTSRN